MGSTIYRTYSKDKNGLPDIFIYDQISEKVRNQIYHIWNEFFRQFSENDLYDIFPDLLSIVATEMGVLEIPSYGILRIGALERILTYWKSKVVEIDQQIDIIQLVFSHIKHSEAWHLSKSWGFDLSYSYQDAVRDLNTRFKENGIGYQLADSRIIRLDHLLLHREAVQEALKFLTNPEFKNANDEYLEAHNRFRENRYSDCLSWCGKAFESTMKIICSQNGWTYGEKDTASPLIQKLVGNNFFPKSRENILRGIRLYLDNSIPTLRNKEAAHGKGPVKIEITDEMPESLVTYMLYTTGITIRLLMEVQLERKK